MSGAVGGDHHGAARRTGRRCSPAARVLQSAGIAFEVKSRQRAPDARTYFSNTRVRRTRRGSALPHRGGGRRGAPARDGCRPQPRFPSWGCRCVRGRLRGWIRCCRLSQMPAGSPRRDLPHRHRGGGRRRAVRGHDAPHCQDAPLSRKRILISDRAPAGPLPAPSATGNRVRGTARAPFSRGLPGHARGKPRREAAPRRNRPGSSS